MRPATRGPGVVLEQGGGAERNSGAAGGNNEEASPALCCPALQVDVATGDKYYQQVKFENGKMVPGGWASNGVKQRAHVVTEHDGGLFLELSGHPPK